MLGTVFLRDTMTVTRVASKVFVRRFGAISVEVRSPDTAQAGTLLRVCIKILA